LQTGRVASTQSLKSPNTARATIERKFTKLLEDNKKLTEAGERTQHGFEKRHEKILKQKQDALEDLE